MNNHIWWQCSCNEKDCNYCDYGQDPPDLCSVCGAAYGELLLYCPGFKLNEEAKQACYEGNVLQLDTARKYRAGGIPYPFPGKNGRRKLRPGERRNYSSLFISNNLAQVIKFKK